MVQSICENPSNLWMTRSSFVPLQADERKTDGAHELSFGADKIFAAREEKNG